MTESNGGAGNRVTVVLLNWNEFEAASACLDRVLASEGVEPDVLVVDNASSGDDAARFTERLGPDRVLAREENTGYAGGMNAGLNFWRERNDPAPVLIITPDVAVHPGTLRGLLDELRATPEAGIAGPVVVYSRTEGRLSAGGTVDRRKVRARLVPTVRESAPHDVDWIDGCCMLVRREALRDVTGFDERYFIYFEETDFCGRVRAAGWRIRLVPSAEVDHPKSVGTLPPYYFYYMVRNRYLFWKKNFGVGPVRVALDVATATARSVGSVAKSLVVPGRRGELRKRVRDARLQLRAARVGTLDHLRGRYGRMPASRMPPARH